MKAEDLARIVNSMDRMLNADANEQSSGERLTASCLRELAKHALETEQARAMLPTNAREAEIHNLGFHKGYDCAKHNALAGLRDAHDWLLEQDSETMHPDDLIAEIRTRIEEAMR
jgi:hypothetical protein